MSYNWLFAPGLAIGAGAAFLSLSVVPVQARDYQVNSIRISAPWSRATAAAGSNAVGYMTITNDGSTPDRLTGASCPVAKRTALHSDTRRNGISRMRPVTGIDIAPGQTVKLMPGGLHLMLMGTSQRLAKGSTFSCTLTFRTAGPADVELPVRSAGATEPLMGPMDMQ